MVWLMIIDYTFWGLSSVLCVIAFMTGQVFREWLEHDYKKHWKEWKIKFPLKPIYIGIAFIILVPLVILFFTLLGYVLDIPTNKMISPTQVRNLAIAFLGTITGIGALFGVYLAILRSEENKRQNDVAQKQADTALEQSEIANTQSEIANTQSKIAQQQADTAEQGLITDRLNKATEGLGKNDTVGNPILEVRIGSLYALERIAQDSFRDHIQIMELLCAYIRYNSPLPYKPYKTTGTTISVGIANKPIRLDRRKNKGKKINEDIQTAITIIGRRGGWAEGEEYLKEEILKKYKINLFECNLCGANFSDANLANASFIGSDMNNASFNDTNLTNASLGKTDLTNARFERAILKDTRFDDATTENVHALFNDFSNSIYLTDKQINQMFLGVDVRLPAGCEHPQEGTDYYEDYGTFEEFMEARREWMEEMAEAEAAAEERAEAEEDAARREQVQMDKLDDERDRGMK